MHVFQIVLIVALLTMSILMASLMGFMLWVGAGHYGHAVVGIGFFVGAILWMRELDRVIRKSKP